jgi:large subunit ribosomal protein L21
MLVDDETVIAGENAKSVKCTAEVLEHGKGDKLTIFRYKPKKRTRRKQGHRQPYTRLKIVSLEK